MTTRETVDEAIDRVASRMTQSDDAVPVNIPAVWLTRPRPVWLAWRVAGVVGVAAVLLAVAIFWAPRTDDRPVGSPVAASIAVPWSPLRAPVSDSRPGREAGIGSRVADARETVAVDRQSRPAWGIPSLEAPTALAVARSAMPGIDVDAMVVDALEVVPLSVAAIDPDGTGNSKEQ